MVEASLGTHEAIVTDINSNPWVSRARDHLVMAKHLRVNASLLRTPQARRKLAQLATLYEELSLRYLLETNAELEAMPCTACLQELLETPTEAARSVR
jgi:hypothetical protein